MQGCAIPALLLLLWSSQLVLMPSRLVFLGQSVGKRAALHLHLHLHLGLSSCGPLTNTHDRRPQPTAHSPQQLACSAIAPPAPSHIQHRRLPQCPVQRLRSPTRHRYQRCSRRASLPHSPSSPSARRHDTTGAPGTAAAAAASRHSASSHLTRRPSFQTGRQCAVAESIRQCAESSQTDPSTARRWRKQGSLEAWRC
jgi:hypothetical protein